MKSVDLTKQIRKYTRGWLALSADYSRVVGVGRTIKLALQHAQVKGVKKPILMKAAKSYSPVAPWQQ